jgi:hypothetical protein
LLFPLFLNVAKRKGKRNLKARHDLEMEGRGGRRSEEASKEGDEQEEQEQDELQSDEEDLWVETSLDFAPFLTVASLRRSQQKVGASLDLKAKKTSPHSNKSKKKGTTPPTYGHSFQLLLLLFILNIINNK